MSGWFFNTHFAKDSNLNNEHPNPIFNQFLGNRYAVAEELSLNDPRVGANAIDPITKYPAGYSKNHQDVLIESFYTTYAGLELEYQLQRINKNQSRWRNLQQYQHQTRLQRKIFH